ncbi:MAG: dihydropteroate synthase [Muribaculaceae bacterium]|nr:dihydropteroate synthase [Muribaculaceae bacterium]
MMQSFLPYTLNLGGRLVDLDRPWVMGVMNVTPDSFYAASRVALDEAAVAARVRTMVEQGADVLDVGACSTRPGSQPPSVEEEMRRLRAVLPVVRREAPQLPVSVDTYRADVARMAVEELGAHMVNDVGGGTLDDAMWRTVASLRVPYVVMHMRGTPSTMQSLTDYGNDGVLATVFKDLMQKVDALHQLGVNDVLADPGFGFAKTLAQNYALLAQLEVFHQLQVPLVVGVSRKSMVTAALGVPADEALNGTTALHTIAFMAGAHIVRAHDVKAAVQARAIVALTANQQPTTDNH